MYTHRPHALLLTAFLNYFVGRSVLQLLRLCLVIFCLRKYRKLTLQLYNVIRNGDLNRIMGNNQKNPDFTFASAVVLLQSTDGG